MKLNSHCQCGEINLTLSLSNPIDSYTPRACDCEFCTQRSIAYLSDSESQLKIASNNKLKSYHHGSNQAEFLACENCDAKGKAPHLHYSIVTPFPYFWRVDGSKQGWKKIFYLDPNVKLKAAL